MNQKKPLRRSNEARGEFEKLAMEHVNALYSGALRLTRNERDAEDLVQDALVRAYRFFDKFEPGTNIKAWLFKILTNTFINKYRRKAKERSVVEGVEQQTVSERFFSQDMAVLSDDPERYIFERLFSDDVLKAIDELPVDFRLVVVLSDIQEFSYKEIADIVGCPVGTVMSRLFRGRRILQARLADYAVHQGILPGDTESTHEGLRGNGHLTNLNDYRKRRSG